LIASAISEKIQIIICIWKTKAKNPLRIIREADSFSFSILSEIYAKIYKKSAYLLVKIVFICRNIGNLPKVGFNRYGGFALGFPDIELIVSEWEPNKYRTFAHQTRTKRAPMTQHAKSKPRA
jgi:hypothetical protein